MARVRPDRTAAIARAVSRMLEPGESVLAGVALQAPGTAAAELTGAAAGATVGALGAPMSFDRVDDTQRTRFLAEASASGVDAALATKSLWVHLVLTDARLLLVRRSRLTRRPRELLAAWRLDEVSELRVPRNGGHVHLAFDGARLRLELPQAHRFLPAVYRELPDRWAAARDAVRAD